MNPGAPPSTYQEIARCRCRLDVRQRGERDPAERRHRGQRRVQREHAAVDACARTRRSRPPAPPQGSASRPRCSSSQHRRALLRRERAARAAEHARDLGGEDQPPASTSDGVASATGRPSPSRITRVANAAANSASCVATTTTPSRSQRRAASASRRAGSMPRVGSSSSRCRRARRARTRAPNAAAHPRRHRAGGERRTRSRRIGARSSRASGGRPDAGSAAPPAPRGPPRVGAIRPAIVFGGRLPPHCGPSARSAHREGVQRRAAQHRRPFRSSTHASSTASGASRRSRRDSCRGSCGAGAVGSGGSARRPP